MILSVCPNPSIDTYAWLNKIDQAKINRIEELKEYPGGKGVHVALAIAELGEDSGIFGNWGGVTGTWIKKACSQKGIKISGIGLDGNNRKCYTFRSSNPDFNNTELLEPGPVMRAKNWRDLKKSFEKEIKNTNLICLSGSWPKNAPEDAYLQLITIAKKQNKNIFLDCSGIQLLNALQSSFFALHLNEHEAFQLCGSKDFEVLLKKLENKVELIAMTRGKKGLWMWYRGKTYIANVKIDSVISTVGSGDCLTAGIAWAFEKGLKPEQIASYGVACGAANCLNEDLGMLQKKDVEKLLPEVNCKTIGNEL